MAGLSDQRLGFRIGEARLAVSATTVTEVVRRPRLTRVPHAPPSLLGLTQLRGATVPVVSLARLMGAEDAPTTPKSRLLLLDAGEPLAVAVDEVSAVSTGSEGLAASAGQAVLEDGSGGTLIDILALVRKDMAASLGRGAKRAAGSAQAAAAEQARAPRVALMTFELAGQAYALPLEQVAEVLAMPQRLSVLPGADPAMLGVLAHRGGLLPIVSLRSLLGLGGDAPAAPQLVIARLGAAAIGFVVDRLGAILRVAPETIAPTPSVLNRGAGEAQIQSICRLDDGRGLVSMLSAELLFRSETIAQILAEAHQEVEQMTVETSGATEQIVVFTLGDEAYGLPIAAVEEVLRMPERLTRVPRAPAFIEGVVNVRGRVIPVIDQRRRFGAEGAASDKRRLIVTSIDGRPAAFVVDSVNEIVSAPAGAISPSPELTADAARLFDRVVNLQLDGRLILLVDPKELLDRAERDLLAAMAVDAPAPG
jgi:purine-binding chemotaxis protein CheW